MSNFILQPKIVWAAQSGLGATNPVDDTAENTFVTLTIPANSMGLNGVLQIRTRWSYVNSATSKTMRIKFGGTNFQEIVTTTTVALTLITAIQNRNATNSQIGAAVGVIGFGSATTGLVTAAVNTAADVTLLITGQQAAIGQTIILEGYDVHIIRA